MKKSLFCIVLIFSFSLIVGCMQPCSQFSNISVTPISIDKDTQTFTVDYKVTYEIINSGSQPEEDIKIVFTMDPDNRYETLGGIENKSIVLPKLNSLETKKENITFTRLIVLGTLNLKNFYGKTEKRESYCSGP